MFRLIIIFIISLFSSMSVAASWDEIVSKSSRVGGFIPYHINQDAGKIWLELNQFEQPFIYYTGLPYGVGSNDIGLDRGQLSESRLVQFERYGNKVMLKQLNSYYRADSQNKAERESVKQAFASSVLAGFPISATSGNKVLIEITPFLLQDLHGVSSRLEQTKQGSFQVDKARSALYADKVKNFPSNSIFESLLTFKGNKPGNYVRQVTPSPNSISVHQHVSFVALPDDNYQTRVFHPNSGFFALSYADYATPISEPIEKKLIYRHRIEKDSKGQIKPIIYYLDPGAPEPVRSALLDGARWWQQAFSAIGMKDVFRVEMLPEGADPLDVRYNVIQWVHRATRGWSYGLAVADPRTGEIIKGHVTLGSLRVRQDLLIANALTGLYGDNSEQKKQAAQKMALARIRQLSAHEVGHTLGIAHNFAASPQDRASVMDYPHPLVELKNGQIDLENAYASGIGRWDIQAIRYGYTILSDQESETALAAILQQMKNDKLDFISDPDARPKGGAHPTAHLWDNGQGPSAELERVLQIRAKALASFGQDNLAQGRAYSELAETLVPLYLFHRYQTEAVAKLIGGLDYSYSVKGDSFNGTKIVARAQQEAALKAMLKTLSIDVLSLPEQILPLIPPKAYGYQTSRESFPTYTGLTLDPISMADTSAQQSLQLLLNPQRLARVLQQKGLDSKQLGLEQLIKQLVKATLRSPQQQGLKGLLQQRLDYLVIKQMMLATNNQQSSPEVRAQLFNQLTQINHWLGGQAKRQPQRFLWLKQQLTSFIAGELKFTEDQPLPVPPGSPIGG